MINLLRRPARGITLVELMIALSLFGVLSAVTFMIFTMGARSWIKAQTKAQIQLESKTFNSRIIRSIEGSTLSSASVAPDNSAVSLLNAYDDEGRFVYEPSSLTPRWQKFQIFYFLASSQEVKMRSVSALGTPLETSPDIIDALGSGGVESYLSGGQTVAKGFESCTFSLSSDGLLIVETNSSREHYGSTTPQTHYSRIVQGFRNS